MSHNCHSHSHSHSHSKNSKYLSIAFFITVSFMIVEIIGGVLSNSLALLSDAGHMLSDALALALSFFAMKLGQKAKTESKTYGFQRTEIIAALINGVTLIFIAGMICFEAFQRFVDQPEIKVPEMLTVASIGLLVNIVSAFILHKGSEESLNVKGAYLHVLGDALGSVGAIVGGIIILYTGYYFVDQIISVVIAVLILVSSINLLKETTDILLEGTPKQVDFQKIKNSLLKLESIDSVHDLHIWSLTNGQNILTCHLVSNQNSDSNSLLEKVNQLLKSKFQVSHTTIQIEKADSKIECEKCN